MPKPEDKPDKAGKSGRTVADWEAKGWSSASIPAGETALDVAYDPDTQDLTVKRQLFDADGEMLKGHGHPKLRVEQTDSGAAITLLKPAATDLTLLYRIAEESEDEDEAAPSAPEPVP